MSLALTSGTIDTSFVCLGDMNISGNIEFGGTCSANLIVSNLVIVYDGFNVGKIDQISTNLVFSSSGNNISIGSTNQLAFKSNNTIQKTAYTPDTINDCATRSYFYNVLNPSNKIYILSSTASFISSDFVVATATGTTGTYFSAIYLNAGHVINGAAYFIHNFNSSTSGNVGYALYNTNNPGQLLASTSFTILSNGSNTIVPRAFSVSYTVPTSGIYYLAMYAQNMGYPLLTSIPYSHYRNYNSNETAIGTPRTFRSAFLYGSRTSFPSTLSGLTLYVQAAILFGCVYTTTPP